MKHTCKNTHVAETETPNNMTEKMEENRRNTN